MRYDPAGQQQHEKRDYREWIMGAHAKRNGCGRGLRSMRNPSPKSIRSADFAKYFGRSPYYLGPNHIRQYQAYLFRDRKLLGQTVRVRTAALRFLYVKTLKPSRSRYRLPRHPLHTWGQALEHHPHVHYIVPACGLSADASGWVPFSSRFFLPVEALRQVFRGKFTDGLRDLYKRGKLQFHGSLMKIAGVIAFNRFIQPLRNKDWVVYAKPPFGGPEQVLSTWPGTLTA
jgi:hypothetical protein